MDVMQKCHEVYLQDSPPFYTEKYHAWKVGESAQVGGLLNLNACKIEKQCDENVPFSSSWPLYGRVCC